MPIQTEMEPLPIYSVTKKFNQCSGYRYNIFKIGNKQFAFISLSACKVLCEYCNNGSNYSAFRKDDTQKLLAEMEEIITNTKILT